MFLWLLIRVIIFPQFIGQKGFPFHEVPSLEFSPPFYWIIFLIICRSSLYTLDTHSSFYQVRGLPLIFFMVSIYEQNFWNLI